jgi:hypothetical protein
VCELATFWLQVIKASANGVSVRSLTVTNPTGARADVHARSLTYVRGRTRDLGAALNDMRLRGLALRATTLRTAMMLTPPGAPPLHLAMVSGIMSQTSSPL